MYSLKQKVGSGSKKRFLLAGIAVVIAAAGIFTFLEQTDRIDFFGKEQPAPTIGPETKGSAPAETGEDPDDSAELSDPSQPGGTKRQTDTGQSKTLIAPSGTFVSNHNPNLDGDPAPNLIQSVCVTTPGATCTITFTKDGTTKSLPEQTTDSEGATYWDWKVQSIGLTTGEWRIKAVAKLGSQTKTAQDSLNLKVDP